MIRWIGTLLFAFCVTAAAWAQASPVQPPAAKTSADEQPPPGPAAAAPAQTEFPWDKFRDFSAVTEGSLVSRDDYRDSHIYRSGNLIRSEGLQDETYVVTDMATLGAYTVARTGCSKRRAPFLRAFPFSESRPGRKIERVPAGKETVDGHVCQVEDLTISGGDLSRPIELRLWEAEDLQGFPIKVETRGGQAKRMFIFTNVVLGLQDPTLFIYPDKCEDVRAEPGKTPVSPPKAKQPSADRSQ